MDTLRIPAHLPAPMPIASLVISYLACVTYVSTAFGRTTVVGSAVTLAWHRWTATSTVTKGQGIVKSGHVSLVSIAKIANRNAAQTANRINTKNRTANFLLAYVETDVM